MTGSGEGGGFGSPPRDPVNPVSSDPASSGPSSASQGLAGPADFQVTRALVLPGDEPPSGSWQDREDSVSGQSGQSGESGGAGEDGDDAKAEQGTGKKRHFWREFPVLVVVALILALVIKTFVVQAFFIPSGSMQNTLAIGDRILVNKLVYHFRGIARGDIVVFNGDGSWDVDDQPASSNVFSRFFGELESVVGISHSDDIYVKRVIGLPGDHVVCCNAKGQITVNGVALKETSYLYPGNAPSAQRFNIVVPPGRLWVMGDHRAISYDSRGHMGDPGGGTIPESAVLGRAFVIIWPLSQWKFLNIPATFEQPELNTSSASSAAAGTASRYLATALAGDVPVREAGTALPLTLGFAGAVPLTAAQAIVRRKMSARRSRRRFGKV